MSVCKEMSVFSHGPYTKDDVRERYCTIAAQWRGTHFACRMSWVQGSTGQLMFLCKESNNECLPYISSVCNDADFQKEPA